MLLIRTVFSSSKTAVGETGQVQMIFGRAGTWARNFPAPPGHIPGIPGCLALGIKDCRGRSIGEREMSILDPPGH